MSLIGKACHSIDWPVSVVVSGRGCFTGGRRFESHPGQMFEQ